MVDGGRRQFLQRLFGLALVSAADPALRTESSPSRKVNRAEPQDSRESESSPVVDVHVHISPPRSAAGFEGQQQFLEELLGGFRYFYDEEGMRRPLTINYLAGIEDTIELMDRGGVSIGLLMAAEQERIHPGTETTNDFVANLVREYPDRLVGIAGHDPFAREWKAAQELERCVKELGMKGMKLYSVTEKYDPYDSRLFPLYEKAIELDVPLTYHTGWSPWPTGPLEYSHVLFDRLDRVLVLFPRLRLHLAHAGGPSYWREATLLAAKHAEVTLDISSWCVYSPHLLVGFLSFASDFVGLDRVMFGTELALCDPGTMIRRIRNINDWTEQLRYPPISEEEIHQILGLNALRTWRIRTPASAE